MSVSRLTASAALLAGGLAGATLTQGAPAVSMPGPAPAATTQLGAEAAYKVRHLTVSVRTGPKRQTPCTVDADLYQPAEVTRRSPAPAILTTNGFGGAKDDANQTTVGKGFATAGYVVLSYTGLGFPNSGCKIHLDDRNWDGIAGKRMVSVLAGKKTVTFAGKERQRSVRYVAKESPGYPRVGMIGGAYGGQIPYAVAAQDDRHPPPASSTSVPTTSAWHAALLLRLRLAGDRSRRCGRRERVVRQQLRRPDVILRDLGAGRQPGQQPALGRRRHVRSLQHRAADSRCDDRGCAAAHGHARRAGRSRDPGGGSGRAVGAVRQAVRRRTRRLDHASAPVDLAGAGTDVTEPVRIELPGVVQRVPAGHTIRLVLTASDAAYDGNRIVQPVTVTGGRLVLPLTRGGGFE